jgi:hypothetical protein
LSWDAEKERYSEAADCDVSAAEVIKEGGVGRGSESARDVGGEGSVFEVCDRRGGGVDGEGCYGWWTGGEHVWGIRVVVWRWWWDVESPHILADSFRANKNECWIPRRKDEECGGGGGGRNQRFGGGERWRGESERGKYQGQTRTGQGNEGEEVKVFAGSSSEDRSIGKGEGHGWELGRAHEVCKRGEDRLAKKDMGGAGVGEDGGRGNRTQQGSRVTGVVVGIGRFQRGKGVGVRETRG